MTIDYINPATGNALQQQGDSLVDVQTGDGVASIVAGIPRFVEMRDNDAESFGWQWNQWRHARSAARGSGLGLRKTLERRFDFAAHDFAGKTILECGMGGGDDTEVLLEFPFAEVHSFDLSYAVDRASQYLHDERLRIAQASIYDIPYPDRAFDFVYCHRVLQHTPDPKKSLRSICKKVKPGGVLFAHTYKRSWRYMSEWRYKYRWLTRRIPHRRIFQFVENWGGPLHRLNRRLYNANAATRWFAYNFIPFYYKQGMPGASEEEIIQLEKLITFDALTPTHDHPMTSKTFFGILAEEGFDVLHKIDPKTSPITCSAVKRPAQPQASPSADRSRAAASTPPSRRAA